VIIPIAIAKIGPLASLRSKKTIAKKYILVRIIQSTKDIKTTAALFCPYRDFLGTIEYRQKKMKS
jgi:hypothetical protein